MLVARSVRLTERFLITPLTIFEKHLRLLNDISPIRKLILLLKEFQFHEMDIIDPNVFAAIVRMEHLKQVRTKKAFVCFLFH